MESQLFLLLAFLFIALAFTALMFLLRDLGRIFFRRSRDAEKGLPQIGRLPLDVDLEPAKTWRGRIDQWFDHTVKDAGFDFSPLTAFLLVLFVGLASGGLTFLWRDNLFASFGVGAACAGLVILFYIFRRAQRLRAIRYQLPEVIELLARALRAGESVDQAIETIGDTAGGPLATEFRRCARHLKMGLSLDGAMRAMARRVPLREIRVLASVLMVQRRAGGNLPLTLERIARVFRDQLSYERQFRAATAAARASVLLIAGIGIAAAIYMFTWQPRYVQKFITMSEGQVMLAVAVGLQLIGLAWTFRLLKSDY